MIVRSRRLPQDTREQKLTNTPGSDFSCTTSLDPVAVLNAWGNRQISFEDLLSLRVSAPRPSRIQCAKLSHAGENEFAEAQCKGRICEPYFSDRTVRNFSCLNIYKGKLTFTEVVCWLTPTLTKRHAHLTDSPFNLR